MPLYSNPDYGPVCALTMDDVETSLWTSISNAFSAAWDYGPSRAYADTAKLRGPQFFADAYSSDLADADVVNAATDSPYDNAWSPPEALSREEQERRIAEEGLAGHLTPDASWSSAALDLAISRKRTELYRQAMDAKASGWHAPFSLMAGFAGGMIDPINIASCFIPVVGEERLMHMLANAGGAWGRAGVRARIGAASGAIGSVAIEPAIISSQTELQADYTYVNSLMNITAGAVLGAALGPVAGHVGEWWRNKQGIEHPWLFAPETETSRSLRDAHAARIREALWHTGMTEEEKQLSSQQGAHIFDAAARKIARATGKSIEDVYGQWRLQYQAGKWNLVEWQTPFETRLDNFLDGNAMPHAPEPAPFASTLDDFASAIDRHFDSANGQLVQVDFDPRRMMDEDVLYAMYRSKAQSISEFYEYIKQGPEIRGSENAYFDFNCRVSRADGIVNEHALVLGEAQAIHIKSHHPDYNGWNRLPDVIRYGDVVECKGDQVTGGRGYIFYMKNGDGVHAVFASPISSKKHGKRLFVTTAFEDNWQTFVGTTLHKYADNIAVTNGAAPSHHGMPAALRHTQALAERDAPPVPGNGTTRTPDVPQAPPPVNPDTPVSPDTLHQLGADGSPQAQIQFFEDARAMVSFFSAADITSAPHEIYHYLRRRLAAAAKDPNSPFAKEYAALERTFGVQSGVWTRAQEEAFADAMVKFLTQSWHPQGSLGNVFAAMREGIFDLYAEADTTGVPISPAMRQTLNGIMTTPPEQGRAKLELALADINTRRWEQELIDPSLATTSARHPQPAQDYLHSLPSLTEEVNALARNVDNLLDTLPPELHEFRDMVRAERDNNLSLIDNELATLPERQKLMEEVVACYYAAG